MVNKAIQNTLIIIGVILLVAAALSWFNALSIITGPWATLIVGVVLIAGAKPAGKLLGKLVR